MTIESLQIGLIEHGINVGKPSIIITCGTAKELDVNEIVEAVREHKLGYVFIEGNPSEYPQEIRDIIKAISSLKTNIVLCCDASEAIENYRRIKTLTFCLKAKAPTNIENSLRRNTFALMKPADNLVITLNNLETAREDFDATMKFLTKRTIAHPLVCIEMSREFKDKNVDLFTEYLQSAANFAFMTKITITA